MISALTLTLVLTAAPAKPTQTKSARDEIARLEKELAEQKALLIKILQMQIEHSQQLLKLAQGQQVTIAAVEAPPPVEKEKPAEKPAPVVEKEKPAEKEKPVAKAQPEKEAPTKGGKGQTATVTGKVKVSGTNGPAWVFIEDVKGTAGGGAMEIRQEGKQFSPRIAVVPRGTKVSFPNLDSIFHNVFSVSEGNQFDLGTARAGDPVKSQVMQSPGVVDIFCNMHSRMSASLLVTPGPLFAKVESDGSFKIDNVPVGTRKIAAWAGGESIARATVEVGAGGGEAELTLNTVAAGAHKNKAGQPYGSYAD